MNFAKRRQNVMEQMEEHAVLILFSGTALHVSADEYAPFEANRNFFYLTGLRRENMVLILDKESGRQVLFIEKSDPLAVRWTGKRLLPEEAKEISQISDVEYTDAFESVVNRILTREDIDTLYFDTSRESLSDMEDYNAKRAKEFISCYPGMRIKNCSPVIAALRMEKDSEEVALIQKAVDLTREGLKNVMRNLTPGMMEYQAQADFEYSIFRNGADGPSFPTIAGSGKNGTMLHYETNREKCEEGSLILLDLGAKYEGYCADVTRTYPVNGRYSEQQRMVYNAVLRANREIAAAAKPGLTLKDLNELCKKILAEECIKMGLIKDPKEIGKYYMHGVSHHLGIDVHDVTVASKAVLFPGAVITDEPGLYIDEWEIGIRIEDDLLITKDGCEVLTDSIIREPDEIERFMQKQKEGL